MGEKMGGMGSGKFWKVLACAFVVVMCLALAACGGNSGGSSSATSSSAAAESSSAAAESSSAAADPAEKFVGDWKLAAAEMEGFTITGDFSAGILGEELSMTITLAADGTGVASFNDETADIAWELKGDDAIAITPTEKDGEITPMDATYEDGVLAVNIEEDEFSGTVYLSPDGTMEGVREIKASNAVDITSESDAVGSWKLTGMNMMGMSMYGDSGALAEQMGGSEYATLEIGAGGTAKLMGEDATWKVGSDGATITVEGADVPLKSLDGDLILDMGSLMSELGVDMDIALLYTK